MKEGFRQSMAWLHTWSGLVVGWVLFFVFVTGTTGYVRTELQRWLQPEQAMPMAHPASSSEQFNLAYRWITQQDDAQQAQSWAIHLQNSGRNAGELRADWQEIPEKPDEWGKWQQHKIDQTSGQVVLDEDIKPRETAGAWTLYRMHYALRYLPYDWAFRIVGICTMLMFVAMITGIITHKKIFKDFFTFRPAKGQRSWLDAHNVLSVLALPFHLIITYSGLIFFLYAYAPLGVPLTYGFEKENRDRYFDELYQREPNQTQEKNRPNSMVSIATPIIDIEQLVKEKQKQWGNLNISRVVINPANAEHPARAEIHKVGQQGLTQGNYFESYDLATGQLIDKPQDKPKATAFKINDVLIALHIGRYADGLIRWAYVITGLIGSAMIATGLVLWTVKRRLKASKAGKVSLGHQLVEKLNIATVAGLPFAVAIFFWANRLLPIAMENRGAWEVHCMFIAWLSTFIYAICRPLMQAWREILILASASYLFIPLLNFLTTDRHLGVTIPQGDWVLVNVEIGFILIGLILGWAAWKVHQKITAPIPIKPVRKVLVKKTAPIDQGDEQ